MTPARVVLALALASCSGPTKAVRTGDMGAQAHRQVAARERAAACDHLRNWDAGARKPTVAAALVSDDVYLDSVFWFDPRTWHREEAERHAARARAHEDAARELEAVEAKECAEVPESSRGACFVLGPVSERRDVEGGILIRFVDGVDTVAIAAHLRCHYAWARARGFDQASACPLDLADVRFEVVGTAILVLGDHPRTIEEIRRRARLQSTPAWRR